MSQAACWILARPPAINKTRQKHGQAQQGGWRCRVAAVTSSHVKRTLQTQHRSFLFSLSHLLLHTQPKGTLSLYHSTFEREGWITGGMMTPPPCNTRWRNTSFPLVNTTLTNILTSRTMENRTALFISNVMSTSLWIRCPLPLRAFFCCWISWIFWFWSLTPAKASECKHAFAISTPIEGSTCPCLSKDEKFHISWNNVFTCTLVVWL